jgi:hypothetical protein
MSKKRYIDTKFWDDNYIIDKDPIEKLLFLYLLTNPLTNIIGIYETSLKRIAFDTGIDREMVNKILDRFEADNKIKYEDGWVIIKNFIKYQKDNPSINKGIELLLKQVPKNLLQWLDTVPIQSPTVPIPSVTNLNLNLNNNLNSNNNTNKDKKERMPITTFSDPKENTLLINNKEKEKKKPNHIEFDFEMWSWHGIDDDIMDRWAKIFPDIEINIELNKMREFFKKHPGHEKMIKEKFRDNFANYIFDWLERAKQYKEKDTIPIEEGG